MMISARQMLHLNNLLLSFTIDPPFPTINVSRYLLLGLVVRKEPELTSLNVEEPG